MKNLPLLIGTLLGTLLLIGGVVHIFSKPTANQLEPVDQTILLSAQPHIKGNPEAAVTLVEFSDFQCPACRATQPLLDQIMAQYGDQVRLIYRHLPLNSIHPNAQLAAQASEVAAQENLFWQYHDLLFTRQTEWAEVVGQDKLKELLGNYAEELGIDKGSFLERIESDHIKARVTEDVAASSQLNIQSTPTIFVNGQVSPASQLIEKIESTINID